jgi:ribonuclease Z
VEWIPGQEQIVYDDEKLSIQTVPLDHRVPCSGYVFREKRKKRTLIREAILRPLTPIQINELKDGKDIFDMDGNLVYHNSDVTTAAKKPYSYAYCSDTRYMPSLAEKLKDVSMVYHEATFMEDMKDRAATTFHTTARQAGQFAKDANIGRLLIGHFSTRYKDLTPVLKEAQEVFENTELAIEGQKFIIS